jgi:hypothetical protein
MMQTRLDFFFQGSEVGYFMDLTDYPTTPGSYRYMPYRSLAHYLFGEACQRDRSARCAFTTSAGEMAFMARIGPNYGIIHIDELLGAHVTASAT